MQVTKHKEDISVTIHLEKLELAQLYHGLMFAAVTGDLHEDDKEFLLKLLIALER